MTNNRPGPDQSDLGIDADAFTAFERAGWERQAPTYDDVIGRAAAAAGLGAEVVGVDAAPAMVELARRLHPAVRSQASSSLKPCRHDG
jgi:hypothetical protein